MTSIALRWEDCDLEKATANLFVKGGRWEEVSLLTETVALLKEMKPPGVTTGLVIPMSDRETKRASQLVKTVVKSLKLEGTNYKSIKSFRSAMASCLLEKGFSPPEAAKMLCHLDEGVLLQKTYAEVRGSHLTEKVSGTSILGTSTHSVADAA